jgi:hypothetical protein
MKNIEITFQQFLLKDMMLFYKTHALSLLHMPETQDEKELPETFPTGL